MEEEGIHFVTNANVGKDIKPEQLKKDYDAVVLSLWMHQIQEISKFRDEKQKEFILRLIS